MIERKRSVQKLGWRTIETKKLMNLSFQLAVHSLAICTYLLTCSTVIGDEPQNGIIYTNQVGGHKNVFVLCPSGQTSGCRYRIRIPVQRNGQLVMKKYDDNLDRLTFKKDFQIRDGQNLLNGWLYESSDKANTGEVFFSKHPVGQGNYPMYYKLKGQASFSRWQTDNGTQQRRASFEDRVKAGVWANQVRIGELGLNPFNPNKTHPIIVSGIWPSVKKDLNRLPEVNGGLSYLLVSLKNGTFQIDLALPENVKSRLNDILQNFSDLPPFRYSARQETRQTINRQKLKPMVFENGAPNLEKIAKLMERTITTDSQKLAGLNLGSTRKIWSNKCVVSTERWSPLCANDKDAYYWKLKLQFKPLNVSPTEYEIRCLIDIGATSIANKDLGQELIHTKLSDLGNFVGSTQQIFVTNSQSQVQYTTSRIVPDGPLPAGVHMIDPPASLTKIPLGGICKECFMTFSKKISK